VMDSNGDRDFFDIFLDDDLGRINIFRDPDDVFYALKWDGNVDFSKLDRIALHELVLLLGGRNAGIAKNDHEVHRVLKLCDGYCDEEISSKYENVFSRNISELRKLESMGHDSLSSSLFVRYDVVVDNKDRSLSYSFFAENPKFSDGDCGIEFSQPVSKSPKKGLLKFIAKTHNDNLSGNLDLKGPLSDMRRFLGSR